MDKRNPSLPKGKREGTVTEADLDEQLMALADGYDDPGPSSSPSGSPESLQSSEYADDNDSHDDETAARISQYADDEAKFRDGLAPYFAAKNNLVTQVHLGKLMKSGAKPLFVYGSKMFAPVLCAILSLESEQLCISNMTPAYLDGYDRFCIKNSHNAAVLPHDPSRNSRPLAVDGMLIFNLTDKAKAKIDEYEGITKDEPDEAIYRKILVHPKLQLAADGGMVTVEAEMYLWACDPMFLKLQPSETIMWTAADFVLWQMEVRKQKTEEEAAQGKRELRSLNGKR
ncbi:uncharacterized protein K452DRAFT_290331 [Aplosporella prunicola CBS 121167]|uniref:Putative gamma-glutamylcyclotransferase n=1 Tax=Aplosporella prunicola CBS 121167 TaxID=1176127 RepID=A0A6A6B3A9_9PEZI|nr:uncharacterized protein K452DRAFT_290331 [Aplosporella prunicola CBS 121167]KAF2138679.1 hypothetical protein K452DRAFT_290331 [Aplosporella prunicola CBS 121167]